MSRSNPTVASPHPDTWRVFRIMSEFVEGFETLGPLNDAITVFGSARVPEDTREYRQARELGHDLAKQGFPVITGGGPGIMEAANRGAMEAGGVSVGLNIWLPREQIANPYQTVSLDFHYFFCRKVMFIKYAKALICFPGGLGTLDEFLETLTLMQTEKMARQPVILVGKAYWSPLVDWMREHQVANGYISPSDLELFEITDDVDWIAGHLAKLRAESRLKEDTTPAVSAEPAVAEETAEGTKKGKPPMPASKGESN